MTQEQRGKHSYIPQRASLPPQGRQGVRAQGGRFSSYQQTHTPLPTPNRPVADDGDENEYDDVWPVRMSSSARRYQGIATEDQVIQQGNKRIIIHHGLPPGSKHPPQQQVQTEPAAKSRSHWVFFVGIAMLLMLVGWIAVTLLLTWWNVTQDDWHYGRPRTYQVDQKVGHGDSAIPSHFIAMNLNHRVQIIECPAGDCTKAVVYLGAQIIGQGDDLAVVTLTFTDVNGDGKLDMLVHVSDQAYVFINENDRFRPARADEHITV
ncbi:MAG: FG-GAP repeat domain-containing protein [Ktedonobacteraceae bacterium]